MRMTSAEYQRQFGKPPPPEGVTYTPDKKPQIRIPAAQEPNKTEAAALEYLPRLYDPATIAAVKYEAMTLLLPSGTKYTPDVSIFFKDGTVECWEVKGGFIHNARSVHALKEAVAAYPTFRWGFAQLKKGEWLLSRFPYKLPS